MRSKNAPLIMCAIALLAAPLLAQEGVPPTTGSVETMTSSDETAAVQVTGTVTAIGDNLIELNVERVLVASSEVRSTLEGKTIAFTMDAATEKPADLKVTDRVDLWFKETEGTRVVTRIVLGPPPGDAATATTAPLGPATEQSAPPIPTVEQGAPAEPVIEQSAPTEPAIEQSAPPASEPLNRPVAASQAPKDAASTGAVTGPSKPAASIPIPSETATVTEPPKAAASTSSVADQPEPETAAPSQPPSDPPELDAGLTEPLGPSGYGSLSDAEIEVEVAPQGQPLLFALAFAALAALVILGLTLRSKHAYVGLGLAPGSQRR